MQENYDILGVNQNASNEEVDAAYERLKNKYSKDRFLEGEEGNLAAKNLTKLENAYAEIKAERSVGFSEEIGCDFSEIERQIRSGNISQAQTLLDNTNDRSAKWHYYQSIVFYKKSWMNESVKQLEIAMEMDPSNAKYKEDYEKLKAKTRATENQFRSGNAEFSEADRANRQMGGSGCSQFLDCCTTWCLMETLCNCCTMGCR